MFNLNKEDKVIIYIYHDYSIPNYLLYYSLTKDYNEIKMDNLTFSITEHYKEGINLMENEYYYLIIQTIENNSNINLDIELKNKEQKKDEQTDNKNDGMKTLHIILIVISSVLILIIVIILIIYCKRKNKNTDKLLEDKIQEINETEKQINY